jgi:hypothetical protein
MQDDELLEKLKKVERLYAGATTPGERAAAADAMARIKRRLGEAQKTERAVEYKFNLKDDWSKKLFVALLHRYSLKPYRYRGQRRNTVMVRAPRSFVDQILWPEFVDLSRVLERYLAEITDRLIAQAIHAGPTEAEVVARRQPR